MLLQGLLIASTDLESDTHSLASLCIRFLFEIQNLIHCLLVHAFVHRKTGPDAPRQAVERYEEITKIKETS